MKPLSPSQEYWLGWAAAFVFGILPTLFLVVKWAIISAALYLRRHP